MAHPAEDLKRELDRPAAERALLQFTNGMGFAVDPGYAITAAHVLPMVPRVLQPPLVVGVSLRHRADHIRQAEVVFAGPCADIAVLQVLEPAVARVGERWLMFQSPTVIRAAAPPRQLHVCLTSGAWTSAEVMSSSSDGAHVAVAFPEPVVCDGDSAEIFGGTSGSPVFDDRGRVVGIVTHGVVEPGIGRVEFVHGFYMTCLGACLPRRIMSRLRMSGSLG